LLRSALYTLRCEMPVMDGLESDACPRPSRVAASRKAVSAASDDLFISSLS
jgi:hypothetical protein